MKSMTLSPRFDMAVNLFPADKKLGVHANLKNDFGKGLEDIYTYSYNVEVVEAP